MALSAEQQALLDALEEEDGSAAPPPIQAKIQQPAVEPQEHRQVQTQAPEPAAAPPVRPRRMTKADLSHDEHDTKMSSVSAPEYYAQKAGNLAVGVAKAPISMVKGMANQYHDVVLDAAAASPFAQYPKPEEIAQPGPMMPEAQHYDPSMEAAGNVLRSGAEFGAMFTPAAPIVGGMGMISGLDQSRRAEDTIGAGEGLGHAGLASMLARHSVAKGMPKKNQAGLPSTAADLPAGLQVPEAALAGRALDAVKNPGRTMQAVVDAAGRIPNPIDAALGSIRPIPTVDPMANIPDGVGPGPGRAFDQEARGFRDPQPTRERMATRVEEFDNQFPEQFLDRTGIGEIYGDPNVVSIRDLDAPVQGPSRPPPHELAPDPNFVEGAQSPYPQRLLPPPPIEVPAESELSIGKREYARLAAEGGKAYADKIIARRKAEAAQKPAIDAATKKASDMKRLNSGYTGTENLPRKLPVNRAEQVKAPPRDPGFIEGAQAPLPGAPDRIAELEAKVRELESRTQPEPPPEAPVQPAAPPAPVEPPPRQLPKQKEPLMSGNTEPGDWSAPEDLGEFLNKEVPKDTVNSKAPINKLPKAMKPKAAAKKTGDSPSGERGSGLEPDGSRSELPIRATGRYRKGQRMASEGVKSDHPDLADEYTRLGYDESGGGRPFQQPPAQTGGATDPYQSGKEWAQKIRDGAEPPPNLARMLQFSKFRDGYNSPPAEQAPQPKSQLSMPIPSKRTTR